MNDTNDYHKPFKLEPTPAPEEPKRGHLMKYYEFRQRRKSPLADQQSWSEYKQHLAANGALSPNLDAYKAGVARNKIWKGRR